MRYLIIVAILCTSAIYADCISQCMGQTGCSNDYEAGRALEGYCALALQDCSSACAVNTSSGGTFGAIAYSQTTGAYGTSDHWPDQAQAEAQALHACDALASDCQSLAWFQNACGAVVLSSDATAWSVGATQAEAEGLALSKCKELGGKNCVVKISHCSQ